jgi:hypothetical protein
MLDLEVVKADEFTTDQVKCILDDLAELLISYWEKKMLFVDGENLSHNE